MALKFIKFSVFALVLLLFTWVGAREYECRPASCSQDGPEVRFPFRLKSRNPQYCGYNPAFDLYCNERNETMLQLPSSEKFMVQEIDYVSQLVILQGTNGGCYPQNYQFFLNLSASPFKLVRGFDFQDYVVFNCSATNPYLTSYDLCLNKSTYGIYGISSYYEHSSFKLVSCTKLHKLSSIPYLFNIQLNWSEPACGHCESEGKTCNSSSSKNNTEGYQLLCDNEPMKKQGNVSKKRLLISGEILGGSILFVVTLAYLYRLYGSIRANKEHQRKIESFLEDYKALKPTRFSYADIRKITNEFSEILGEGGYGTVYKGKVSSEIYVAVKVLNNSHGNGEEFVNEVGTIGRIHHVNVVRLVGYCADGFRRALVYEFLPNDSLEKFIFTKIRSSLSREKIQDIALGVAKGIEYLHQGCDQQILHFDIKPNNILLDQNFNPKICDFGLAKLCSKEQSAVSMTAARGTLGYIAPEMLSRTFGRVSYKSDVYSFGMLLLEMVGGRKNLDHSANTSQVYFPQWIYNRLNRGEEISVLQTDQDEDDESKIARKLTIIGLWCIQWHPTDRPSMKTVVQMLEGDGKSLAMPPNPFPASNAHNSVARVPRRHNQIELEIISEN